MLDVEVIRKDFPILDQIVNDEPLVYLDNAATTQKPLAVLETINRYYEQDNANVHRGVHTLAERATASYEAARETIGKFINAGSTKEVLFTRGTTTSLNWVARFAEEVLTEGDQVLISVMEHHSNIIPWQEACRKTGAELVYVYLKDGALDMDDLRAKLTDKVKVCLPCSCLKCPGGGQSNQRNHSIGPSSWCHHGGGWCSIYSSYED